ncbi:MAG: cytidine deaminase [Bacteroidetes bacterium]|nr:cytidine deaminase [Bacteroidota bacterium]MBL6943136.1 cytidine deaminase [Bacteroidales bacterium]
MEVKKISISYEEYEDGEPLASSDLKLIDEATTALKGSYAPYSDFHVGAALLMENGDIIRGSNQENAAYPSGLCAERVALFHANSERPGEIIVSLAITGKADHFKSNEPITPCGACRQVIAETEKRQNSKIRIIMKGEMGNTRIVDGIANLLPMMFQGEQLKKQLK